MARVKGSDVRTPDRPIDPLFVDRWSPRAMSGEPITREELLQLFEAARWAPSSGNSQPWRMLYAHRDSPHWPTFFGLLASGNQAWCVNAAVLVVFVSQKMREGTDKPLPTHSYDTGSAWMSLAYQGWISGYVVHGMAGFDYDRARTELGVPDGFHVERDVRDRPPRADREPARIVPCPRDAEPAEEGGGVRVRGEVRT